ncbi:MAG: hypothetical protein V2A65_09485 [Candidatus Omnitrophota bacterium]
MSKVRFFTTGVTRKALEFLEAELNEWVEKTGITITEIQQNFGQAPTGMSGSSENVLFLAIWYEPKESGQEKLQRRATDKSEQTESNEQKVYIRHTDKHDMEAQTLRKK